MENKRFGRVMGALFVALNIPTMIVEILTELEINAWWSFLRGAGFTGSLIWTVLLLYGLYIDAL